MVKILQWFGVGTEVNFVLTETTKNLRKDTSAFRKLSQASIVGFVCCLSSNGVSGDNYHQLANQTFRNVFFTLRRLPLDTDRPGPYFSITIIPAIVLLRVFKMASRLSTNQIATFAPIFSTLPSAPNKPIKLNTRIQL